MSLAPPSDMFSALPDYSATNSKRKDSIPQYRTYGNKKMAEARRNSKTQPSPQISELSQTDSPRHSKGEVELQRCLGDSHSEEKLLKSYSCAWQKDGLLMQGRMYITISLVCFYSNLFGSKLVIPCDDVTSVTKQNTAIIFPNAILITTSDKKYVFASFMARRKAYATLQCVWKNVKKEKPLDYWEIQGELKTASGSSKTSSEQQTEEEESQVDDSFDGESSVSTEDSVPFSLTIATNMDKPTDENSSAQQCSTTAVCGDSESSTNHNSLPPQGEFSGSSLEDIFHPSPSLIVLPSKNCILDDDVEKDSVSRHRLSHKSIDRASEEKEVIEETDNDQELDKGVGWKHFYHQCKNKLGNICMDSKHPLSPTNLINILIVILIIILIISSLSLLCKLSCVDPKLQPWMSWQPWCSQCTNHIKPSQAAAASSTYFSSSDFTPSLSGGVPSQDIHSSPSPLPPNAAVG